MGDGEGEKSEDMRDEVIFTEHSPVLLFPQRIRYDAQCICDFDPKLVFCLVLVMLLRVGARMRLMLLLVSPSCERIEGGLSTLAAVGGVGAAAAARRNQTGLGSMIVRDGRGEHGLCGELRG